METVLQIMFTQLYTHVLISFNLLLKLSVKKQKKKKNFNL